MPFIRKEKMANHVVLIDISVSEKYRVRGYPTLCIINKNGKAEYAKLGYSENLEKEVDSVLNKMKQQN